QTHIRHQKIMPQTVLGGAHHFFQAAGVEQGQNQATRLVEQAVVVTRHVHQLAEALAQLDIAFTQQLDLALDQGDGMAGLMGNAQLGNQLVVVDKKFRVLTQISSHGGGVESGFGHRRICPSYTRTAGPVMITGRPGPAHSMDRRPPGNSSCTGDSSQPWRIAATAAAQAPVPQAWVSPAPRSQTRRRAWWRSMICTKPTLTRCGKRGWCSRRGPSS